MHTTFAVLLCAAVLVACTPGDDELRRTRLDEVATATFATTLAFTITLDTADGAAAAEADGEVPGAFADAVLAGVIEGDAFAAGLTLAGLDLAQLRVTGPSDQFLRIDLAGLAALAPGGTEALERQLAAGLASAGLSPSARDAVLAAARGEWVRLDTPARDGASVGRSVGAALEAVLRSATPVDAVGRLDRDGPFDGQLTLDLDPARAAAAVGEALAGVAAGIGAGVAEDVGGTPVRARVVVDDGVARTITLDLVGDGQGGDGEDTTLSELVLDLRPLPTDEPLVRAPEVAAVVTVDQLRAAVDALAALTGAPPEGPRP